MIKRKGSIIITAKKLLSLLMVLIIAAGLAACSLSSDTEPEDKTVREQVDQLEDSFDYSRVWEMGGPEDIPLDAQSYHATWDEMVDAGWVERTLLGYPSNDDKRYPVYMYTLKPDEAHVDPHYTVRDGDLHDRPKILITSGFHGAEKATPVILRNVVHDMMTDPEFASIAVRYEWTFIPLVNPWGFSHSALKGGTLSNGFIHDSLSNYTVVENGEYNQGIRVNADGRDCNRDWHDGSGGCPSEEAKLVRDVLVNDNFDLVLDMHQTKNTEACGFISVGKRNDDMSKEEYEENCREAYTSVMQAGIITDRLISEFYGVDKLIQTSYPWDGTDESTFRNYAAGYTAGGARKIDLPYKPRYSMCMEISLYCTDYSGDESGVAFNSAANTYGNTLVHYFFKKFENLL